MDRRELHPQVMALLKQAEAMRAPPVETLTPHQVREAKNPLFFKLGPSPEEVAEVRDVTIPSDDYEIPLRIYIPAGEGAFPLFVYFHGGGWLIGNLDTHDSVCRILTNRSGCVVVSVGYRLAPEHKFPVAVEDAYAATQWVSENAARLHGDAGRLAVGGDSSGGNLATVTCLLAKMRKGPRITFQVLIYPVTNLASMDNESYRRHGEGYILTQASMQYYRDHYLATPDDAKHPTASPLLAEDLTGLPPAFILAAKYDVLFDEIVAYAERLKKAGVDVDLKTYTDMIHGFFCWGGVIDRAAEAIGDVAEALRKRMRR